MSNLLQRHPFHLVDSSPWPFLISSTSLAITFSFVIFFNLFYLIQSFSKQVFFSFHFTLYSFAMLVILF